MKKTVLKRAKSIENEITIDKDIKEHRNKNEGNEENKSGRECKDKGKEQKE